MSFSVCSGRDWNPAVQKWLLHINVMLMPPPSAYDTSMKYCRIFVVVVFMSTDHEWLAMLIPVFSHFIKRPFITISGSSTRHTKKIKNKIKPCKYMKSKKKIYYWSIITAPFIHIQGIRSRCKLPFLISYTLGWLTGVCVRGWGNTLDPTPPPHPTPLISTYGPGQTLQR